MVQVRLLGGLGNQMFQYAFGRTLALLRSDTLVLDSSFLARVRPPRQYALDAFRLHESVISTGVLDSSPKDALWTVSERRFAFDRTVLDESRHHGDIYTIGWWQSHHYFAKIAHVLRDDFRPGCAAANTGNSPLLADMHNSNSVSLHVRRTDYCLRGDARGALDLSYYEAALQEMQARVNSPTYFIFSDDISWCKKNLAMHNRTVFVTPKNSRRGHPADELLMMSSCKHHIIANSTYSWWAAWLSQTVEKVVIAPHFWFRGERSGNIERGLISNDLIPHSWIRL